MAREPRRPPLLLVVACGLLGAALASQINHQRRLASGPRVGEARLEQVLQLYDTQRRETARLQDQLEQVTAELAAARSEPAGRRLEEVEQRLDTLTRFAGLAPLQGPGVRVVIRDATLPVQTDYDQNPYTVHDQDLLLVANELWAAGAEALEINGQRLVAGSEVRCSGPVINVNGSGLTPPYRLLALGDPDTLAGALEQLRGGVVDQLRNVGIDVKITKEVNLQVKALAREPTFRYARPAAPPPPASGG